MTADEIRNRKAVVLKLIETTIAAERTQVEGLFLIAEQLAELNEKLDPARLVSAIEEIQGELEKRDKKGGSR